MTTLSQTKELFRRAEAVCFDVDSTVIKEEGIDELAKFCGVGDAVTEMYVCERCQHHIKLVGKNMHRKVQFYSNITRLVLNAICCYFHISGLAKPWAAQ